MKHFSLFVHFIYRYKTSEKKNIEITDYYTEQLNFELVREKKIMTRLVCD